MLMNVSHLNTAMYIEHKSRWWQSVFLFKLPVLALGEMVVRQRPFRKVCFLFGDVDPSGRESDNREQRSPLAYFLCLKYGKGYITVLL